MKTCYVMNVPVLAVRGSSHYSHYTVVTLATMISVLSQVIGSVINPASDLGLATVQPLLSCREVCWSLFYHYKKFGKCVKRMKSDKKEGTSLPLLLFYYVGVGPSVRVTVFQSNAVKT